MIKFLIQRPIAVLMAFTACFIIGLVTYSTLPISLLPNIAIPEITIQVSAANTSARELENTIVKPLRSQLIQVSTLKDIHSESRDGAGIIRLSFDFGTNTDLAFIEVNEKIDAAMNYLPKETERPKVIKASATDIPVFYLNLTLKNDSAYSITGQQSFLDLCEFAESVIKRRIEQLEEVAMVDVTGLVERQVQIVPDEDMLSMLGISIEDIESTLAANNVEPGSMTVRDGYYEYNIKFSTLLRTAEDVENIYLRKDAVKHIVTKSEPRTYTIQEIDGRRAEDVYTKELGISPENITEQTMVNPLGRVIGDETYIISIKERTGNGSFSCYRKVNPKDNICFLQAGDHKQILQETIESIHKDFSKISGVFSVNCLFRYLYFQQKGFVNEYLEEMGKLGSHAGLVGLGEHYNGQHTNQTMSAVVFE